MSSDYYNDGYEIRLFKRNINYDGMSWETVWLWRVVRVEDNSVEATSRQRGYATKWGARRRAEKAAKKLHFQGYYDDENQSDGSERYTIYPGRGN